MKNLMKSTRALLLQSLAVVLVVFAFTGCDPASPTSDPFSDGLVARGTVQQIGSSSLTVNATDYAVTGNTEFVRPLTGLSDLSVGKKVAMKYEKKNGAMQALAVGNDDGEEDDGDDDEQEGDHQDEDEQEVSGSVSEVGADFLVVSDTTLQVNGNTEFEEGYTALSDVQTGDQAEVEYETQSDGTNVALEVEKDDGDEGDDDDDHQDGDDDDGDEE